jgi:hypothetical protein
VQSGRISITKIVEIMRFGKASGTVALLGLFLIVLGLMVIVAPMIGQASSGSWRALPQS